MTIPSAFNPGSNDIRQVENLAYDMGWANSNSVLTAGVRLLKIIEEFGRAKAASQSWVVNVGETPRFAASTKWEDLEEDLTHALQLWLTVVTNAPVERIDLVKPGPRGGRVSIDVPGKGRISAR